MTQNSFPSNVSFFDFFQKKDDITRDLTVLEGHRSTLAETEARAKGAGGKAQGGPQVPYIVGYKPYMIARWLYK